MPLLKYKINKKTAEKRGPADRRALRPSAGYFAANFAMIFSNSETG